MQVTHTRGSVSSGGGLTFSNATRIALTFFNILNNFFFEFHQWSFENPFHDFLHFGLADVVYSDENLRWLWLEFHYSSHPLTLDIHSTVIIYRVPLPLCYIIFFLFCFLTIQHLQDEWNNCG